MSTTRSTQTAAIVPWSSDLEKELTVLRESLETKTAKSEGREASSGAEPNDWLTLEEDMIRMEQLYQWKECSHSMSTDPVPSDQS
jgi:hypothetical protein